jgi:phosphopantothenoylcysteine decarboxylase/phosphopantothenate--cysteine ligase
MLEAVELAQHCAKLFQTGALTGKRVVITAGPTREALDPVRYISNHSSGKMGFSLAEACIEAGAHVTLISGPVHLATPDRVVQMKVISALDMLAASQQAVAEGCDLFIATAAVADYRPANWRSKKLKK